jgi:hypothetical protein
MTDVITGRGHKSLGPVMCYMTTKSWAISTLGEQVNFNGQIIGSSPIQHTKIA